MVLEPVAWTPRRVFSTSAVVISDPPKKMLLPNSRGLSRARAV
jgi:hypothetical protein